MGIGDLDTFLGKTAENSTPDIGKSRKSHPSNPASRQTPLKQGRFHQNPQGAHLQQERLFSFETWAMILHQSVPFRFRAQDVYCLFYVAFIRDADDKRVADHAVGMARYPKRRLIEDAVGDGEFLPPSVINMVWRMVMDCTVPAIPLSTSST